MARGNQEYIRSGVVNYLKVFTEQASKKTKMAVAACPELERSILSMSEARPASIKAICVEVLKRIATEKAKLRAETSARRSRAHNKSPRATRSSTPVESTIKIEQNTDGGRTEEARHSMSGARSQNGNDNPEAPTTMSDESDVPKTQAPTRVQLEVGVIRAVPELIEFVKQQYGEEHGTEPQTDKVQGIFEASARLDFYMVQNRLVTYLNYRLQVPGLQFEMPSTWDSAHPHEIFEALQTIKKISADTKIHRAYAQMELFSSVNTNASSKLRGRSGRTSSELIYLEQLARDKAGPTHWSGIYNEYHSEYLAGKKWSQIADWFGGSGIVFVLILADIGVWYITQSWTEYQRGWLKHISQYLPSILALVKALGSSSLRMYCRYGFLSQECISTIEALQQFEDPDAEDSDNEDSDDENSDDEDSGAEDSHADADDYNESGSDIEVD